MIATITLNPSLDDHITVDGLKVEEANRWVRQDRYAGGKGINVSRAIYEMGGITVAYGFIGGINGRALEILLDEEGVLFSFTPIQHETRVNLFINDSRTDQQTRIDAPGPHITKRDMDRFFKKIRGIRPRPDMMVTSGSAPPGVPAKIYYDIIKEGQASGVRTILDAAGRWLAEGIKAKPYLIKPNVHEAEELLKRELPTEETIIQAALDLVETGIEVVAISRGETGLIAADKKSIIKAVPPPVKVRSKVGAGDCTVAGLALKLAYGDSLPEACRLAVAMGTACVLTSGTELCHREDVEKLLPKIKVWEIPLEQRPKSPDAGNPMDTKSLPRAI
ncbi:MAG: 1-phosphofructokinase [Chloroflexota bacterium]